MRSHRAFDSSMRLLLASVPAPRRTAAPVDDPKARRIVEEADRIRFPAEGFQVDVAIVTTGKDKAPDERKYRVLSKGNENTVVMITEPASERGQILLMKGHELWVFLPNVSQPVRLSLAQRLTGQVANGDLARANFAGDYNPRCCAPKRSTARNTTCSSSPPSIAASRTSASSTGCASRIRRRTRPSSIRRRTGC